MATHGRSGLRRLLLGSVAEAVLRHAHVPVIVFPPPAA
jgi:nucleotide-binding universal stress UspA family protein